MTEPSVEETVARLEGEMGHGYHTTDLCRDLAALIADWRKRGEALEQIPALTQEHGGAAKAIKLCRDALTPQQQPPA